MSAITSQITGVWIMCSVVCSGADQRKHKVARHWPLWGESTSNRWTPLTRASNAENVSISWPHYDMFSLYLIVGKHFASMQALHRLLHLYCFSITATNGILNQAYRICISKARHNSLQSLTMELNIHKLLTPAITLQIRWYRNTVK